MMLRGYSRLCTQELLGVKWGWGDHMGCQGMSGIEPGTSHMARCKAHVLSAGPQFQIVVVIVLCACLIT